MKKILYIFLFIIAVLIFQACTDKNEDYYTEANVQLLLPDTITTIQVQGTITLKNLSTGRNYTSSRFNSDNAVIFPQLLRGVYSLDIEGTIRFRGKSNHECVKYYRASSDYIEIVKHPAYIKKAIIFM